MTNKTTRQGYEDRLNRVVNYVYDHLDDDLDLAKLADVAAMSPYHWHRVYQAFHSESAAETVKRLRLQRAAAELTQTTKSIEEIATRAGYGSAAAFNRAFALVYDMPPGQYRKERDARIPPIQQKGKNPAMYQVSIETVPHMKLAAVSHTGSYLEIGRAFQTLYSTLGARNMMQTGAKMVGIYYDDPNSVPVEKLLSKAAVTHNGEAKLEPPLEHADIPAGTYASLLHKGPYSELGPAYQWLCGEWLMSSGRELADKPAFEEYLNTPMDTAQNELLTKIYMPLKD
jgi:AraC family transcriptional regulator